MILTALAVAFSVATLGIAAPPTWAESAVPPDARKARSVGAPNSGRLVDAVALPETGDGFRRRDRDTCYGTDETVALLEYAGAQLAAAFPGTAPFFVGDMSDDDGGRLSPHKSHQSGRDVDIGFLERRNRARTRFDKKTPSDALDYVKTWFIIETLLMTGRVQYVFVNQSRIGGLMTAAAEAGWPEADIDALFLEKGETPRRGVIRQTAGHTAHFHVRFRCPVGDKGCKQ